MRPIVLATDYGVAGSYVGQLKCAIYKIAPNVQVIDLIHDLPAFNPKAAAYLLASYLGYIPKNSIVVGVVDPGVGSNREPIVLDGDGYTFIGPNNGLFSIVARKLSDNRLSEIILSEEPDSKTFHGRDIFAPIAAQFVIGTEPKLEPISVKKLIGSDWPEDFFEIIYIDYYGNAITGITSEHINKNKILKINEHHLKYAETFFRVNKGECFWYCNSNNLIEIAAREASVAAIFQLAIGNKINFM